MHDRLELTQQLGIRKNVICQLAAIYFRTSPNAWYQHTWDQLSYTLLNFLVTRQKPMDDLVGTHNVSTEALEGCTNR